MVSITKPLATTALFRARTTTGDVFGFRGTALPVVRQDSPAVLDACYDATRVAISGQPFADMTPLGHPAWSPPL